MDDLKTILAGNLARLMAERLDLDTQVKLAKRAGLSQSTVGRVLRGDVYCGLDVVAAISRAFRVDPLRLLSDNKLPGAPLGADASMLKTWHQVSPIQQAHVLAYLDVCLLNPTPTNSADYTLDTIELANAYQSLPRETATEIAQLRRLHGLAMHMIEDALESAEPPPPDASNPPTPLDARPKRARASVK